VAKFLLVTDLDNTLVGDDQALAELNQHLTHHRQEYGTLLVYSTGRSPTSYRTLTTEHPLLEPDALVASVGTEIYRNGTEEPDPAWAAKMSQGWDRDLIVATAAHFADLVPQPESEQRPFKVSYFLSEAVAAEVMQRLEALLRERNLDIKLVYSGGKDLDILPRHGDKGEAMEFLRQDFGIAPEQTVACGDSGNDRALFHNRRERGIIVGNARPELLEWHYANPSPHRYLAEARCAGGILEGLRHFQFLSES